MRRIWLPLLALLLGNPLMAEPVAHLARRELGGFSLKLPAAVNQQAGGIDSRAGRLNGPSLLIDYDLGLYADPLPPREGASGREERAVVVDGLPGRLVRWRQEQPAPTRYFVGLHLPAIGSSGMGPIRLTLLAQTLDAQQMDALQDLLLSLQLTR